MVKVIVERAEIKKDVFRQLDELTLPDTILSSNTSSISITGIAAATDRPERVIGMHFVNPSAQVWGRKVLVDTCF